MSPGDHDSRIPRAIPEIGVVTYRWNVPDPHATGDVRTADGTLIVLRRHGNPEGPRLIVSHGSGLATDVYYPFWSLLAKRFDLILYDFRNHGWSARSDVSSHNIATFVADNRHVLRDIDRHFGAKPKVGVFHSLSATTALHHDPPGEGFSALVCCSTHPYTRPAATCSMSTGGGRSSQSAPGCGRSGSRRARSWPRASGYERLLPGVPDLIVQATLRPSTEEEGYELRCPRAYEALIFEYAFAYNLEPEPSSFSCPVKVIGSDPTASFSFLPRRDLGGLTSLDYDFVPDTTHFLRLENPHACAAQMLAFLEQHGLA